MARRPWQPVLDHIRSLAAQRDPSASDAELLNQYVARRDEDAFAALVHRHGAMVLRVARRVLSNDSDADDVFQATFLLLSRRAAAIRKREAVAGWLHGVAHRLALSARAQRQRRQERERQAAEKRPTETPAISAWSELEETLHEVLAQLPEKYRTPLVSCYLEGRTQEEVAQQLGAPLGTVRSWLARGRELLRKRLLRRGISLSAEGASAALLTSACAPAEAVSPSLRIATLKAVHLFATGENAMTLISPSVADLVRQGMTTLFVAKLKSGAACVLIFALLLAGSGWAAHRRFLAEPSEQPKAELANAPPKRADSEQRPRTDLYGDPLPPGAVARLGTVRFRHEDWLRQFALSPDGRTLAATAGKSVALWDMATGRPLRRFPLAEEGHCLAFTPDGKSLAVGGSILVYLFDLASGKKLQRFITSGPDGEWHQNRILGVAFTPDGRILVTWGTASGGDKITILRRWETHSRKLLGQFRHKDWIVHGISPDGKLLTVGKEGSEKTLRLWDVAEDKEIRQLTHPADVSRAAFSQDGKTLAVASGAFGQPGRITLWDQNNGKELGVLTGHRDAVLSLAFMPDGKRLASAGFDLSLRLWDVGSKEQLGKALRVPTGVGQLAFSADGKTLLSKGMEHRVLFWHVAAWRERVVAEGPEMTIRAFAYSPDGELIASSSGNSIWLWKASTGKLLRTLEGHQGLVLVVKFSATGKFLISESIDTSLRIWDARTGKEQSRIEAGGGFELAALSPDGKILAASRKGRPGGGVVRLWSAETGEEIHSLAVDLGKPAERWRLLDSLCFAPDGKILYASDASHSSILRWDVATAKALPPIGKHDGGLNGIALAPDGQSIAAVTNGGSLYVWETATGQMRLRVKDAGYTTSVAFSPDGRLLALADTGAHSPLQGSTLILNAPLGNQQMVRLVRIADGKVIRRFAGHLGGIGCLCFSPDGRTLASGGHDTTVLVWDVTEARKGAVKQPPPLKPEKLAELWKGLRGTAAEAHGCMSTLISAPGQVVPFLREKLKPIVAMDAKRFAQLLKKLDSDQFSEREEATRELKELGEAVEPALRKAIQDKPTLEARRRLQSLLDDLSGDERLRSLRAIEVLERIGDKPARDLLQRLSQGAAGAWLTQEARTTLQRLK